MFEKVIVFELFKIIQKKVKKKKRGPHPQVQVWPPGRVGYDDPGYHRDRDLSAAMAASDYLVDYMMGSAINTISKSKTDGGKKCKVEGKPSFTKKAGWKGTKKGATKAKVVETTTKYVQQTTRSMGCFICNDPH